MDFYLNEEEYLPLTTETLNLICACSDEDQYSEIFKEVFYEVMYVNPKEKLKYVHKWFDIIMHISI